MKQQKTFVGDFETVVFDDQEYTEVWAAAVVELNTEDVKILHSINETYDYLISLNCNLIIYFHNLKFDGTFWIDFLINKLNYKQALTGEEPEQHFQDVSDMENDSFKYLISDQGQWYDIVIRHNYKTIEIRDSLKLLPFSVKKIGESFKTKHKKLEMEYKGKRFAGCEITEQEKEYIANDVLVIKEALEIMFSEGHNALTIGSCCLREFRKSMFECDYSIFFPDLTEIKINKDIYGSETADEYVRRSYKGGWCYLVKGKENKKFKNGITADVNSLYPSMMSSDSGNRFPIGKPTFWSGNFIPWQAKRPNKYFFIRIKTRFYLKKDKLPCIQLKNNLIYRPREWLETSDVCDQFGIYHRYRVDVNGEIIPATVVMTLTQTDFRLIQEQYNLRNLEILDGCYFDSISGIFDSYINKYRLMKMTSTGARRELAKLFLNNLYGKMASSTNSSFKIAYKRNDETIGYYEQSEFEKKAGYIPIGSAITSYARNFTIRTAQKNYYGKDKAGFIYADTDSIHCDLKPEELKGISIDQTKFCCWKLEAQWDIAFFTRAKTYIEHITTVNQEKLEKPFYGIKCAGMPQRCKDLFEYSMKKMTEDEWKEKYPEEWKNFTDDERKFVLKKRDIEDFTYGLVIPSKLMPKTIKGGVVLQETKFEMR